MPSESVVVYVKANRSVSLEPREIIDSQSITPLDTGYIDRKPWKQSKPIDIPRAPSTELRCSDTSFFGKEDRYLLSSSESDTYTSLLVYNRIAKHMTWKRLTGSVKEYIVVENPLV